MSLWSLIEGGISSPSNKTCGQRLSAWFGRHTACRNKNVFIHKSSLISPDARINPRKGKISIGESCVIAPNAVLQGNIRMGNNCSVQYNSLLIGYGGPHDTEGFITIGNNVRIAPNVMIISANHIFSNPDNAPASSKILTVFVSSRFSTLVPPLPLESSITSFKSVFTESTY